MSPIVKRVILVARPHGIPQAEHFRIEEVPIPILGAGEVLVRNRYLSVDPAMRGWVSSEPNYAEPVAIGAVMRAHAAGEVVESDVPAYPVSSVVMGEFGWQEYAAVPASAVWRVVDDGLPVSLSLGVLGLNGLTAWGGVREVLRPEPGQTVVVSTGAGAVGSIVGQLCKAIGCRTVAIAGGAEKCAVARDEFGYDAAVDYKSPAFADDLAAAVPGGVDRYFDNTGGAISDAVLQHLGRRAVVAICGTASVPSWDPWPTGPRVERVLLTKQARMEGLLAGAFMSRRGEAFAELAALVRDGRLRYREDVLHGIESAPDAIAGLYRGDNLGKRVVALDV